MIQLTLRFGRRNGVFGSNAYLVSLSLYLLAGMLIFLLYVRHLFHQARARHEALEIGPPQERALLRPPGHYLQEKLFALAEEQESIAAKGVGSALFATLLLVAAISVGAQIAAAPSTLQNPMVQGVALTSALALVGASGFGWFAYRYAKQMLTLRAKFRATKLGLRGEQAVAEALQSPLVVQSGYFSFHDLPKSGGGNIDHVVVGPGGVFLIETKARSQRKPEPNRKRNQAKFDGRTMHFPWGGYDEQMAEQTRRNAEWLRTLLASVANVPVEPLLVLPGWNVQMEKRCEIKAMSANWLQYYLTDRRPVCTPEQLKPVLELLDKRCRTVTF